VGDPADHQQGARAHRTQKPWQGSFAIDELTDLVEEAVYRSSTAVGARRGAGRDGDDVQRSRIQEESLYYETLKHDGRLPIVGVNTFLAPATPVRLAMPS